MICTKRFHYINRLGCVFQVSLRADSELTVNPVCLSLNIQTVVENTVCCYCVQHAYISFKEMLGFCWCFITTLGCLDVWWCDIGRCWLRGWLLNMENDWEYLMWLQGCLLSLIIGTIVSIGCIEGWLYLDSLLWQKGIIFKKNKQTYKTTTKVIGQISLADQFYFQCQTVWSKYRPTLSFAFAQYHWCSNAFNWLIVIVVLIPFVI